MSTHEHVLPLKLYLGVWGGLMVLTALTVTLADVQLGWLNVPVALLIASVKALLVALFFMHLLYDEKFNLVVFLFAIAFIVIFLAFTLTDPLTRGQLDPKQRGEINPSISRLNPVASQTAPAKPTPYPAPGQSTGATTESRNTK